MILGVSFLCLVLSDIWFRVIFLECHLNIQEENSIKLVNTNFSLESHSIFCWHYQIICKLSCEAFALEAQHI